MAEREPPRHTLWHTVQGVAASFFGVQSSRNRERDFTHGKASQFIVIGLVATLVFVATLILVVKIALRHAGS